MERIKSAVNHASEYWYMGSMEAMSATQKNRQVEWKATGL